jgi:hypothetical protein
LSGNANVLARMREKTTEVHPKEETWKDVGEAWTRRVFSGAKGDAVYYPEPRVHAGGGILNGRLSIPRAAIFHSTVWRGIPSFAAAPPGPET